MYILLFVFLFSLLALMFLIISFLVQKEFEQADTKTRVKIFHCTCYALTLVCISFLIIGIFTMI